MSALQIAKRHSIRSAGILAGCFFGIEAKADKNVGARKTLAAPQARPENASQQTLDVVSSLKKSS
jgi:hypothetical protein